MAANTTDESRKFSELILYVARESEDDPRFGATKLNKILFYADFLAYRQLGSSISGQEYQKLPRGPAPRGLLPAVSKLEERDHLAWAERSYFGRLQKRPIALRDPDLSVFSAEEVDLNGTEVSDLSHEFLGWRAGEEREAIPYCTALVPELAPLSEDDQAFARESIREYLEQEARDRQTAQV